MSKDSTVHTVCNVPFTLEGICGMTFMQFETMCKKAFKDCSWKNKDKSVMKSFNGTTIKKVYDTLANAVHKAGIETVMPKK